MTRLEAINYLSNLTAEDIGKIIDDYYDPNCNLYSAVMLNGYDFEHIVNKLTQQEERT